MTTNLTSHRVALVAIGGLLAALSLGGVAQAADNIRYIRSNGSGVACTLAAPCRFLQQGINATPAGGELHVLDSAAFGANATIGKSMTISGNGATISTGTITINSASAKVALRGLVLNGGGATANGIVITAAAAVHIESCTVHGFTTNGIFQNQANADLFFIDSIARDNGEIGLFVDGNGTTATVTVDNARFEKNNVGAGLAVIGAIDAAVSRSVAAGNSDGIVANSAARMTVTRTVAANNAQIGYRVLGGSQMTLESSEAHGNGAGLQANSGGTARISNSTLVNNNTGITNPAGTVLTRQNNTVSGNTTNTSGALTVLGGT